MNLPTSAPIQVPEFSLTLEQYTEHWETTRLALILKQGEYISRVFKWIDSAHNRTPELDNQSQLFLALLIIQAELTE